MVEQGSWLVPPVRTELPRLARGHHTDNTLPRICTEFLQCVSAINNKVSLDFATRARGLRGRGGRHATSVDVDNVLSAGIPSRCGTLTCRFRRLKPGNVIS